MTRRHTRMRGAVLAALAMGVLSASQAPGIGTAARAATPERAAASAVPGGAGATGGSPFRTELPPLATATPTSAATKSAPGSTTGAGTALPQIVLAAYRRAAGAVGCGLRWELLAAIGQVESGQARGGRVTADGTARPPILGPRLDGDGFALVPDTDGGAYDGDAVYDRAVGPMQFIPSTWARWGADGNGDGRADPENVYDAALAAARYLCAAGGDLTVPGNADRAILAYNHSPAYLRTVGAWYTYFLDGHGVVATTPAAPAPAPTREQAAPSASPRTTPTPEPSATPAAGRTSTPSASATPSASPSKSPEPALSVPPVPGVGSLLPTSVGLPLSTNPDTGG